ncbi:MAG TPA: AsmA-like C-terminal region-containing protein, partial [Candidatus Krumholzibacteria bacterium]|nr:AsmA-like C-terminal region-containing protein [Candidatus Krumholzibacteria bacterium]
IRPWIETELQWEMDPAQARARLKAAGGASLKDLDFTTEFLRGSLRAKGELPASSAGPSAWLDLVQIEGEAEGVKIKALGREDLVSAALSFAQHGDQITLDPLQLILPGATLSGRITAPALGKGRVNGELKLQRADLGKLKELVASVWHQLPDSLVAGSTPPEQWSGIAGGFSGTISLKLPLPLPQKLPASAVTGNFSLGRIALAAESLSDSLVIRSGTIAATSQSAELSKIVLTSTGLEGTVAGKLDAWPQEYRFIGNANFALVDLDKLLKESGQKQARASGRWWSVDTAYAQEAKPEFPAPPEKLKMQVQLAAQKFRSRGYEIENLTGHLDLQSQVMKLSDLKGSMGGGKLVGQGSVDWKTKPSTWKGQVEAQQVSATSCLSPFAPKLAQAFQSSFSGLIQLNGPLTSDRKAILQALGGGGALKGSAGDFLTGTLLGEELDKLPGKMADKLRDIPFKEFLAQVRFEGGKAHFDQAILKGPTQLKADGWAGFDGTVDYQLELKLPVGENLDLGSLTPLSEFLREKDGRITIPFHVSGPSTKPKVTPELDAAEKRAKDAVNQNLGNKLQDLLNGLKRKKGGG